MSILICKCDDLVFDRGAIARSHTFDLTGIKRRLMKILSNRFMYIGGCVADVAIYLRLFDLVCRKRECDWPLVRRLTLEGVPIDGSAIQPGRRSCFEPADRKTEPF